MKREEVYKIVDSELDYVKDQEKVEGSHVVEDFPLSSAMEAIRYNLRRANEEWYNEKAPYPKAMEFMRKIAGVCVNMGVRYGMPGREGCNVSPKWKIGSKVRITSEKYGHQFGIGDIVEIKSKRVDDIVLWACIDSFGNQWWIGEEEGEIVQEVELKPGDVVKVVHTFYSSDYPPPPTGPAIKTFHAGDLYSIERVFENGQIKLFACDLTVDPGYFEKVTLI